MDSRRLLAAVVGVVVLAGAMIPARAQSDEFAIVVLPDTQIYSRSYPHIFKSQTEWIVRNRSALNIRFVLGVGDIVDNGSDLAQFRNADAALQVLDAAGVPYLLPPGNHDYDNNRPADRRATLFNQFFGPGRYAGKPYYQGNYPAGSNENFYGILDVNGRQMLVIALEFTPRTAALQWASSILAAHRDKDAIIATHSYLFSDDSRVAKCDSDSSATYGLTADNDGEEMWHNFVKQHSNVVMVLSGHIKIGDGTGRLSEVALNGNLVNQVLANYQAYPQGGGGYLRILRVRPSLNRVDVSTYSPYLDAYLSDPENQFSLRYKNDLLGASGTGYAVGRIRTHNCTKLGGVKVASAGQSTTTDSVGLYRLAIPGPHTGIIRASAVGYRETDDVITIHSGYDTAHDFWMTASTAAGALRGRVTYALDGSGVPGATVSLGSSSTASDSAGYFSFADVTTGTYTLSVNKTGWLPASTSTTVYSGSTTTQDVQVSTAGVIRGRVVDRFGGAVSGATIAIEGGILPTARSLLTGSAGDYSTGWVPIGSYTVNVTVGNITRTASVDVASGATTVLDFALSTKTTSVLSPTRGKPRPRPGPRRPGSVALPSPR